MLQQRGFTVWAGFDAPGAPLGYVAKYESTGFLQGSGAGIFSRGGLAPQHPGRNHDIESAEPGDDAAHRRIQQERANAGIVAQKVIPIPQAEPWKE